VPSALPCASDNCRVRQVGSPAVGAPLGCVLVGLADELARDDVADGGLVDAADPAGDALPAVSALGAAAEACSSGAAVVVAAECREEQPASTDSTTIASTLTAGAETFMVPTVPLSRSVSHPVDTTGGRDVARSAGDQDHLNAGSLDFDSVCSRQCDQAK
jgi:hypothetical protein